VASALVFGGFPTTTPPLFGEANPQSLPAREVFVPTLPARARFSGSPDPPARWAKKKVVARDQAFGFSQMRAKALTRPPYFSVGLPLGGSTGFNNHGVFQRSLHHAPSIQEEKRPAMLIPVEDIPRSFEDPSFPPSFTQNPRLHFGADFIKAPGQSDKGCPPPSQQQGSWWERSKLGAPARGVIAKNKLPTSTATIEAPFFFEVRGAPGRRPLFASHRSNRPQHGPGRSSPTGFSGPAARSLVSTARSVDGALSNFPSSTLLRGENRTGLGRPYRPRPVPSPSKLQNTRFDKPSKRFQNGPCCSEKVPKTGP